MNLEAITNQELQLLLCHGLQIHSVIMRLHAKKSVSLQLDSMAGDDGVYLKRMQRWKGQTQVDFVILTFLTPMPVMARYSSGAATLYDMLTSDKLREYG